MSAIILKNKTPFGANLEATFLPDKGMNLISYKLDNMEVIDQSTRPQFEARYGGLGPLIGPHFHRRRPETIPPIKDESLFPHIAKVREAGGQDPFSHGIARYAPWKANAIENKVWAELSGKDHWNGVPLSALEGQNFKMTFKAELQSEGLLLDLSVVSESDSLVGIHYYYHLPQKKGKVVSEVQDIYIDQNQRKVLPKEWNFNPKHVLTFDLQEEADYTFFPFPKHREGKILLDAGSYRLQTSYSCISQENSWQLYHPAGASFVCIEPVSSQDPRHPNLTVSSIRIHLQILEESVNAS